MYHFELLAEQGVLGSANRNRVVLGVLVVLCLATPIEKQYEE
jgi:hypothetical protein